MQKDSFCYVSAKTGYGIEALRKLISDKFFDNYEYMSLELSTSQNDMRSSIYQNCNVIDETFAKSGHMKINFMASKSYIKYLTKKGYIDGDLQKNQKNSEEIHKTG